MVQDTLNLMPFSGDAFTLTENQVPVFLSLMYPFFSSSVNIVMKIPAKNHQDSKL